MEDAELAAIAADAARTGAAVAMEHFRTAISVEEKDGKTDYVTVADREAQEAVIAEIARRVDDDPVVGEEAGTDHTVPSSGRAWIVDPIDGTHNFIQGNRRWTTSVACVADGDAVAAANVLPALGDTYVGTADGVSRNDEAVTVNDRADPDRCTVIPTFWWDYDRRDEFARAASGIVREFGDLQRIGSAQAALSMLAAGTVEGVITNLSPAPWDTVAGAALVRWAGGTVTDLDGDPWSLDARGLVASNGQVHECLHSVTRQIESGQTEPI